MVGFLQLGQRVSLGHGKLDRQVANGELIQFRIWLQA